MVIGRKRIGEYGQSERQKAPSIILSFPLFYLLDMLFYRTAENRYDFITGMLQERWWKELAPSPPELCTRCKREGV